MHLQLTLSTSTKQCRRCKQEKPTTAYHKNRHATDGLCGECKACMVERNQAYRQTDEHAAVHAEANRRFRLRRQGKMAPLDRERTIRQKRQEQLAIIQAVRAFIGCQICGETDSVVLDFHHRDAAAKSFEVSSRNSQMSMTRIFDEMQKCHVLCANCHRRVHANAISVDHLLTVTQDQIDSALT